MKDVVIFIADEVVDKAKDDLNMLFEDFFDLEKKVKKTASEKLVGIYEEYNETFVFYSREFGVCLFINWIPFNSEGRKQVSILDIFSWNRNLTFQEATEKYLKDNEMNVSFEDEDYIEVE